MSTLVTRTFRAALPALLFLFALPARGGDLTVTRWTNAGGGDWLSASNWTDGLPGPGYAAVISNGGTAVLANSAETDALLVGYPIGFTSDNPFTGTLIVGASATAVGSLQVPFDITIGGSPNPNYVADGTVTISNGAALSQNADHVTFVGGGYGSTGRLTISDSGSVAYLGTLYVGASTSHGTMTLQSGAFLHTGGAIIGTDGSSSGWVTLSDGARWSLPTAPLDVGLGATGLMNIASGSSVRDGADANIGANPGSNGSVTVTGNGSVWQTARIFVGGNGGSSASGGAGALHVLGGGQVQTSLLKQFSTGFVEVDNGSTSTPGLIVSGAVAVPPAGGSLGDFAVGNNGAGRMEISAGGLLFTSRGFMGGGSGSDGFASITNSGSQWNCSGSVWVGNSGSGTLMLSDHGYLSSLGNGYIGFAPNTAGYATVTDQSQWNMAGTLFIGGNGAGPGGSGTLLVDFATVNAAACVIYNTGGLIIGYFPQLLNPSGSSKMPITVKGGYLQFGYSESLFNGITLASDTMRVYTSGNDSYLSGHITGPGGLSKSGSAGLGAGSLTLTGNNDYSGATTVSAGFLFVTGSITSPVTVSSGGELSGSGTVGSVTLNNNGTLYPGYFDSAKMTVNGNYNQTSGGILFVQLFGTGPGQFNQVVVSNAASIGGTLNVSLGTFHPNVGDTFQIIASNGATGEFSTINSPGCTIVSETSETGVVLTVTEVFPTQTGPDFIVTNTQEHFDGACTTDDCTLREAIYAANANPDPSIIRFAADVVGTIVHTDLNGFGYGISRPVTIEGPGARILTISGNNAAALFTNDSDCTITGLTIAHGNQQLAGAIYNRQGQLTLRDCTLSGNRSLGGLGGGAIFNQSGATLTLERCSLTGNFTDQFGGGVYNDGIFTATNCTFAANTAQRGGGIISRFNNGASSSTLRNCTFSGNTATSTSGGAADGGGAYYAEGGALQHHVGNTIIARNTNSVNPDVRGSYTSDGHNFIGRIGSAVGFTNSVNGDQVGTNSFPLDPQIGALEDNGGPTQTLALLSASTAIDAGDDTLAPLSDQRGYLRAGVSDIGAFEFDGLPPVPTVLSAVSRKMHGGTGTFDIALPLTGSIGVECRSPGAGGNHQVIVTFASPVSVSGVSVMSSDGLATATRSVSGAVVTLQLSAVANAQTLGITLIGVSDGTNVGDVLVPMGVLLGDTTGNGSVNASDISQAKLQSGHPVSSSNFRNDITVNGSINATDVSSVKLSSGTALP